MFTLIMARRVAVTVFTTVLLFLFCSGSTFSQSKDLQDVSYFTSVDAESQDEILKKRLFVLRSRFGFIVDVFNDSPLQEELSKKVVHFGPPPLPPPIGSGPSSTNTAVVQNIPTETIANHYIEGGLFFDNFFNAIYRNIPPRPIFYIPFRLIHGILNLIGSLITGAYTNLFYLIVDNSLNEHVFFFLDDYKAVEIPSKKQICIIFRPGRHGVRVLKKKDGRDIESFSADFPDSKGGENVHYIYNVAGNNNYRITHASYTRE